MASQEVKTRVTLAPGPTLEKGWVSSLSSRAGGKLEPIPDAHLDGVLPRVILGKQLISICVQLVDGFLLFLQPPVDEVLDGER